MSDLLGNIIWNALTGPHAKFSMGGDAARRYAAGFAPLTGFPDPERPDIDALVPLCEPGEVIFFAGWSDPVPPGWEPILESTMFRMVWDGGLLPEMPADDIVPFAPKDALPAVELAALTRPGPFGPRTPELGDYFGCFEGSRLIAMAGERMFAPPYREVSGVCTHPDFQGRGLARRLMTHVIRRQLKRGEIPFLHVMCSNTQPHDLYLRMGFRDYQTVPLRILRRMPQEG